MANFKEAEDAYSRGNKLYNGRFEIEINNAFANGQ